MFQKVFINGISVHSMIGEIVEPVVFDDGYWDEALIFARYTVQQHVDDGYSLDVYAESHDAWGRRRVFAKLRGRGDVVIIFASPEDGLVVSRRPALPAGGNNNKHFCSLSNNGEGA